MNADRWARVKETFAGAMDQPPDRRDAWLAANERDPSVQQEVASLIDAYTRAGAFIEAPAVDTAFVQQMLLDAGHESAVPRIAPGTQIGPYEIVRHLAEGGMGSVYLARRADAAFEQQVAVKFVRADLASPAFADRLRRERRILATLEHPHIARLLDGGATAAGVPYAVMEYVDGVSIDEWCRDRQSSVAERVQLFRIVCDAVHYAHQHLVIHRDIKAGNILVSAERGPKLLDFGISKLLDPGGGVDTRTAWRAMTPEAASPEQIAGEPMTVASDVYALGVLLYRLLSDVSPYQPATKSPADLERAICDVDPVPPSRRAPADRRRAIAGDLDLITLQALRKQPQQRYASVAQLADDLDRHAQGRPVAAAPDAWRYRAGKFVGRHRAVVAAAAAGIAALLIGGTATIHQARVAQRERVRAERRLDDVRTLANAFLFDFPETIKNTAGSTHARTQAASRAVAYLDGLAAETKDDPRLARETARGYLELGDVLGNPYVANLGDTKRAIESYQKALAHAQALTARAGATADDWYLVAISQKSLGDMCWAVAQYPAALDHYRQGLQTIDGPAATSVESRELRPQLNYVLGQVLYKNGRPREALPFFQRAAELNDCTAKDAPVECRRTRAISVLKLGDIQRVLRAFDLALVESRRASEALHTLAAEVPSRDDYARLVGMIDVRLASDLTSTNQHDEAVKVIARTCAYFDAVGARDPSNVQGRGDSAFCARVWGEAAIGAGDLATATRVLARGAEIAQEIMAKDRFFEDRRELALIRRAQARVADLRRESAAALAHRLAAASLLDADGAESELAWELSELHEQIGDTLAARAAASRMPASAAADRAAAATHYATSRTLWSALEGRGALPDADRGRADRVAAREARLTGAPSTTSR